MSIYDLIKRTQYILKKYEKYDAPIKTRKGGDDPFLDDYEDVKAELEKLTEAAEDVMLEINNRALMAAKYAEIRRIKGVLLNEAIPYLGKRVKKGRGVNKKLIAHRREMIQELTELIYAVPDGTSSNKSKRPQLQYEKGKKTPTVVLNHDVEANPAAQQGYYDHTEETQLFEKEWQEAKKKQDVKLDRIGEGVDILRDMAQNISTELDRQMPVIDDIEQQMDKVTNKLKTNNAKLKGVLNSMRSRRNFCVDIILITVLLAIGAYIYAMFM